MSRFFNALSSSSDSDEGSDNLIQGTQKPTQAAKFLVSSDDDDTDVKRTIKSDVQKKLDLLNDHVSKINTYSYQNQFKNVLEEYDSFVKTMNKSKSSFPGLKIPWFVIKCLVSLETLVEDMWKNTKQKSILNKVDQKALAPLRQKIKKNNIEFQSLITEYKTNPENCIDDFASNFDNNSEELEVVDKMEQLNMEDDYQSSSSDEIGSDDDNDETGSDDSTSSFDIPTLGDNQTPAQLRQFFMKKEDSKATVKRERKDKDVKVVKKKEEVVESEQQPKQPYHETKLFSNEEHVSLQTFLNKIKEIIKSRGKKSYYLYYKNDLNYMMNLTKKRQFGIHILCGLTLEIVMAIFENLSTDSINSLGLADDALMYESAGRGRNEKKIEIIIEKLKLWVEAVIDLIGLVNLCLNPCHKLVFSAESDSFVSNLFEPNYSPGERDNIILQGDLYTFVNMADEHFVSLLNACDHNVKEYIDILHYKTYLNLLIDSSINYYKYHIEKPSNTHIANRLSELYLIRMELSYFRPNKQICQSLVTQLCFMENTDSFNGNDESSPDGYSIKRLYNEIIKHSTQEGTRVKASLYYIYHLAINNELKLAEHLFFSLNIQNKLKSYDIYAQIQYNRTVAQLAICYFRVGHFQECNDILSELWNTNRLKELIGQASVRTGGNVKINFDKKRDIKDKRYPVPYYMQLNFQLIEALVLLTSMLLYTRSLSDNINVSSKMNNKYSLFLEYIKRSNNHIVSVSPSNTGEYIVSAAKHIKNGDWKSCYSTIIGMNILKAIPMFSSVQPILLSEIKKQCLLAYLGSSLNRFASIKLATLVEQFELSYEIIRETVTTAILCEEIKASLDETLQTLYPIVTTADSSTRKVADDLLNKIEKSVQEYTLLGTNKNALTDITSSNEFN